MNRIESEVLVLFDDESVKEKLKVMDKWEAMIDDERNLGREIDFADQIEEFVQFNKKYKLILEEVE